MGKIINIKTMPYIITIGLGIIFLITGRYWQHKRGYVEKGNAYFDTISAKARCMRDCTIISDTSRICVSKFLLINEQKVSKRILSEMLNDYVNSYGDTLVENLSVYRALSPCNLPYPYVWWKHKKDTLSFLCQDEIIEFKYVSNEKEDSIRNEAFKLIIKNYSIKEYWDPTLDDLFDIF